MIARPFHHSDLCRLLLLVLSTFPRAASSTKLNVESESSGRELVSGTDHEPYLGHVERLQFNRLTCVTSVHLHSLTLLTGVEEIDLLYSECDESSSSSGGWKPAAYRNEAANFTFFHPIWLRQLTVASARSLSILHIEVHHCSPPITSWLPPPTVRCEQDDQDRPHASRPSKRHARRLHHRRRHDPVGLEDHHVRRKRETSSSSTDNSIRFSLANSPHIIDRDVLVPVNATATIEPGVVLVFRPQTSLYVFGTLVAVGNETHPIILAGTAGARRDAENPTWNGVHILPSHGLLVHRHPDHLVFAAGVDFDVLPICAQQSAEVALSLCQAAGWQGVQSVGATPQPPSPPTKTDRRGVIRTATCPSDGGPCQFETATVCEQNQLMTLVCSGPDPTPIARSVLGWVNASGSSVGIRAVGEPAPQLSRLIVDRCTDGVQLVLTPQHVPSHMYDRHYRRFPPQEPVWMSQVSAVDCFENGVAVGLRQVQASQDTNAPAPPVTNKRFTPLITRTSH